MLTGADLEGTRLTDADLKGTDLSKARRTCPIKRNPSRKGATMPSGQKYDDWLK